MEDMQLPLLPEQPEPEEPKKKARKPRTSKPKVPNWIKWTRGVSAFSVLAGGFGLMQPQYFWLAVFFIYGGLVLLGLDLWYEPELKQKFKLVGEGVILVGIVMFSWQVVFVSLPLKLISQTPKFEIPSGTNISGITWLPMYSELDVIINNPSDGDYTDLNVIVKPDYPVAQIAQMGNLGGVSFEDTNGTTFRGTIENLQTTLAISITLIATDAGYRIHCDRIPPQASLRLVMALVDIRQGSNPRNSAERQRMSQILNEAEAKDLFLQQTLQQKDGSESHYWYGSVESRSQFDPRPRPKKLHVFGSYIAKNRPLHVDEHVDIL